MKKNRDRLESKCKSLHVSLFDQMNQSRCGLSFLNVESLISLISLHLSHVPQETGDLHTSRHQWAAATGPHSPPRPSRTSDRCQIMMTTLIYIMTSTCRINMSHQHVPTCRLPTRWVAGDLCSRQYLEGEVQWNSVKKIGAYKRGQWEEWWVQLM